MKKQYSVGITFENDLDFTFSLGKLLGMKTPYWETKEEAERQLNNYIEYVNKNNTIKVYSYQIRVREVTEWEEVTERTLNE